jgi:hypothetical protein
MKTGQISITPFVKPGRLGGWVPMLRVKARGVKTATISAQRGELIFHAHAMQAALEVAEDEKRAPVIVPARFFLLTKTA